MLNLNFLNINLDKAKKEHFNFFACYVTRKIKGGPCTISNRDTRHPNRPVYCKGKGIHKISSTYAAGIELLQNFVIRENRLEKILLGTPEQLHKVNEEFEQAVNNHFKRDVYNEYLILSSKNRPGYSVANVHQFFTDLSATFNYDRLSDDKYYSSYKLTENLGVRSCVYCNRTYALTHRKSGGGRLMNPQLDHWFPQSKYPLLQISFHNLIPSCEICNSRIKNDIEFNIEGYFHPYQKEPEKLKFNYRFDIVRNNYRVYFDEESNEKIKKTSELLFIDEMYNAHTDELKDLITLQKAYSTEYLNSLKNAFPGANLSDELIYRLAFGTELLDGEFHKRPMSKFKHDILKELGII